MAGYIRHRPVIATPVPDTFVAFSSLLSPEPAKALRRFLLLAALSIAIASVSIARAENLTQNQSQCVVLLHGLARVSNSMAEMERKLNRAGFSAVNVNYPSRRYPVETLATLAVGKGLAGCREKSARTIHFVTHSLGGILLRYYQQHRPIKELGRVVMLGPPNQGSELVNALESVPGFSWFAGPTGIELGTRSNQLPGKLGPVNFELGVIAGSLNLNPLTLFFMRERNDSIVTVRSTRVEGMDDHRVYPVVHTLMMRDNEVIEESIHFLHTGRFMPVETPSESD